MTHKETLILGVSWLLINLMAGYGAAKFFGIHAWIYVVFIMAYVYTVNEIASRRKK